MTYNVFGGTLNSTLPLLLHPAHEPVPESLLQLVIHTDRCRSDRLLSSVNHSGPLTQK